MRVRNLGKLLRSIALAAPLAACSTSDCPDDIGIEMIAVPAMPDAELMALLERCRTMDDCEPLCSELYERDSGVMQASFESCELVADGAGEKVVLDTGAACIGRRPRGYRCAPHATSSYLARQADLEAASVRAFADLHADLRALGAPRSLRRATIDSAGDEIRHARLCDRLSGAPGHRTAIPAARRRSLVEVARDNIVEGCVRETFGAVVAAYQARAATDPVVRSAMSTLARDEARHAALAWRIHDWILPQLDAAQRAALASAFAEARAELDAASDVPVETALGVPDAATARGMLAALEASLWSTAV